MVMLVQQLNSTEMKMIGIRRKISGFKERSQWQTCATLQYNFFRPRGLYFLKLHIEHFGWERSVRICTINGVPQRLRNRRTFAVATNTLHDYIVTKTFGQEGT